MSKSIQVCLLHPVTLSVFASVLTPYDIIVWPLYNSAAEQADSVRMTRLRDSMSSVLIIVSAQTNQTLSHLVDATSGWLVFCNGHSFDH